MEIQIATVPQRLRAGDTVVIPGDVVRQVRSVTDSRAVVAGYASAVVAVAGEPAPRGTPEWMS